MVKIEVGSRVTYRGERWRVVAREAPPRAELRWRIQKRDPSGLNPWTEATLAGEALSEVCTPVFRVGDLVRVFAEGWPATVVEVGTDGDQPLYKVQALKIKAFNDLTVDLGRRTIECGGEQLNICIL